MAEVPENLYCGELVRYPGAWSFLLGKAGIILVSDKELEALADPDRVLNLTLTFEKREGSLRQVCEQAQAEGHRTLILAFDHFFSQYRPGQAGPRRLTPDMDAYIQRIAAIGKFAQGYGLGLELSLLSPLEIGPAYANQTGEAGLWLHYRKGYRDPNSGAFSVSLWQQKRWTHNKGVVELADAGVRVFAFHETPIPGTPYRHVDPQSIVEITEVAQVELPGTLPQAVPAPSGHREDMKMNVAPLHGDDAKRFASLPATPELGAGVGVGAPIRIYGRGRADIGAQNRVLAIQQYRTPEMDYFSDKALPFLTSLVDRYADAGVKLNALYSDEMHIQQDWHYFRHHDNGAFALRYVSPELSQRFAERYGAEYADLAKYLVYFVYGQEDYADDLSAKSGVMHVFGPTPEAIRKTALFRARYYHLLQDGVTDLFAQAKRHAEKRMGYRLEARAHATWAESPTVDKWDTGQENMFRNGYEYTSNFVWSNTVHQAAAACYDYFKWGDFLTGNGNDHAEIGWLDRNYVGLALACSTGILNEVPYSYAAHWGMPHELARRRATLVNTYGAAGSPLYGLVQNMEHRDVSVLMLYPIDLVAVEERFGSWMTQYGYANLVTQAKLLERGRVVSGVIVMGERRFTTLVATFEPFPAPRLLRMMRELAESGGRVIWSGPPPVLSAGGVSVLNAWKSLFGVDYAPDRNEGRMAPGRQVAFTGSLAGLPPQVILTDFLVDRIYPVTPRAGTEIVATVKGEGIGTHRPTPAGGSLTFLGFRPRDDQSRSLGYESRWWFDILHRLGAYPPTGVFPDVNDNTEFLSRTTDYLACRFPNGAIALCRHFREVEEDWPGGFARNDKEDEKYLKRVPPPSEALDLRDFRVNGRTVTYVGQQAVTFRVDTKGRLRAFAGCACRAITIDGRETVFADREIEQIAFARVLEERRVALGAVFQIWVQGAGTIRIPAYRLPPRPRLFAEGPTPGSRGAQIPCRIWAGALVFTVDKTTSGRWLYVTA
jgi:hypothetical protein